MEQNLGLKSKCLVYTEYLFTIKCSESVWGHSVHFWFFPNFDNLVSWERLALEWYEPKFEPWG